MTHHNWLRKPHRAAPLATAARMGHGSPWTPCEGIPCAARKYRPGFALMVKPLATAHTISAPGNSSATPRTRGRRAAHIGNHAVTMTAREGTARSPYSYRDYAAESQEARDAATARAHLGDAPASLATISAPHRATAQEVSS